MPHEFLGIALWTVIVLAVALGVSFSRHRKAKKPKRVKGGKGYWE